MSRRIAGALRVIVALLVVAALPSRPTAAPPAKAQVAKAHIATGGEQDCIACHKAETPAAYADWEKSPHGVALVKCIVCHGSTGKDFKAKPVATGCNGCHAAQVDSVAKRAVADCFACHVPHTLSAHPHR